MSTHIPDTCRRAAEILDEKGWTQGRTRDGEGRVCGYGAVMDAAKPGYDGSDLATRQFQDLVMSGVLAEFRYTKGMSLPTFNDKWYTTKGRVKRALRKTARHYEKSWG